MQVVPVLAALAVGAVLVAAAVRGAFAARAGRVWPTPVILILSFGLVLWFLALGFAVGWALASNAVAGAVGAGTAGVLVLIVGPLMRVRGVQSRLRSRGSA